jgi:hypothetical protein
MKSCPSDSTFESSGVRVDRRHWASVRVLAVPYAVPGVGWVVSMLAVLGYLERNGTFFHFWSEIVADTSVADDLPRPHAWRPRYFRVTDRR